MCDGCGMDVGWVYDGCTVSGGVVLERNAMNPACKLILSSTTTAVSALHSSITQ